MKTLAQQFKDLEKTRSKTIHELRSTINPITSKLYTFKEIAAILGFNSAQAASYYMEKARARRKGRK